MNASRSDSYEVSPLGEGESHSRLALTVLPLLLAFAQGQPLYGRRWEEFGGRPIKVSFEKDVGPEG